MKYKMIVKENCPKCEESKKIIKESGSSDKVEFISVNTEEGMRLARRYKIAMAGMQLIDEESEEVYTIGEAIKRGILS